MNMQPVQSSNIDKVGYDAGTRRLRIEFHGGRTYDYGGVAPHEHLALINAPSIGQHFHARIRARYTGRPVAA